MEPKSLPTLGIRNAKDVVLHALQKKIEEQGNLRKGFDVTTDFPSRETYKHTLEDRLIKRRIVVRNLANEVERYGIGDMVGARYDPVTKTETEVFGWADNYVMEISIYTTSSEDADNIAELVKLWMLELTHDLRSGNLDLDFPFFFDRDAFMVRFMRGYEGVNHSLRVNGPIYIRTLSYHIVMPFYHESIEQFIEYKLKLVQHIESCLELDLSEEE